MSDLYIPRIGLPIFLQSNRQTDPNNIQIAHINELPLEPPPPFPKSKYSMYRKCVAGRGRGMLSCVGDHILQEFNTLYLTRFRTYKTALKVVTNEKGEAVGDVLTIIC